MFYVYDAENDPKPVLHGYGCKAAVTSMGEERKFSNFHSSQNKTDHGTDGPVVFLFEIDLYILKHFEIRKPGLSGNTVGK